MKNLRDRVAVITGAASGIGRALAINLADEGCHVAIADINRDGLKETAALIGNKEVRVTTHRVDVSKRDQVYKFAASVVKKHGSVDIVINNAGAGLGGMLEEVNYEEFEWLMGINFWGVVYSSMAFLPHLKQREEANLVNVSSVHGIFTNPGVGPYCSSKFAVRGFTQVLCQELRDSSVRVSCVHPGGIKTNIVRNARIAKGHVPEKSPEENQEDFDKFIARTSSEKAARIIIRGIRKNKSCIMVGRDAHIYSLLTRLFPVTWQRISGVLPDLIKKLAEGKNEK
jgi:NAD(P)-dependent dehydrogenase (short-subunit alcohol dehydrogenase family)